MWCPYDILPVRIPNCQLSRWLFPKIQGKHILRHDTQFLLVVNCCDKLYHCICFEVQQLVLLEHIVSEGRWKKFRLFLSLPQTRIFFQGRPELVLYNTWKQVVRWWYGLSQQLYVMNTKIGSITRFSELLWNHSLDIWLFYFFCRKTYLEDTIKHVKIIWTINRNTIFLIWSEHCSKITAVEFSSIFQYISVQHRSKTGHSHEDSCRYVEVCKFAPGKRTGASLSLKTGHDVIFVNQSHDASRGGILLNVRLYSFVTLNAEGEPVLGY